MWRQLGGHSDPPLRCGEETILAPREHHPHGIYIGAWLDVLRADEKAIFRAASAASKAADFVLSGGEVRS
jgi:antirestriction protein ArdC